MTDKQRIDLDAWHPTSMLRFVLCTLPVPGEPDTAQDVRVLQQLWQHCETGRTQWRDVDFVTPEREAFGA